MSNIILIGPILTGKSTLADILSQKLGYPRCSVDDVRWQYYEEIGYSKEKEREIRSHSGSEGVYKYWKPFEAHAVIRILQEHKEHVIDFGGGHSVYEDSELFSKVERVLQEERNIFLILPSADKTESLQILNEREFHAINKHFVEHQSNHKLAKHIIYTKDKTPEECAEEIISLVRCGTK
ncbi:shikimate kinase [Paenibacillus thiaminolyticus]|uniref:shikimate kinase n=1 Tax=Paenibacillus thiaminolyticus TaxID=49283 RepID=UPI002350BF56|nr:shikimate kinase [Paenibacillus thiaminolyticus]WCR26666.1 shikimate kinase [Paenibacillus thiaminolyticus]